MQVLNFVQLLFKMYLLSPKRIVRLVTAIRKHGINIMILLQLSERVYGNKIALTDDEESISYKQLRIQCETLAMNLQQEFELDEDKKVAFLCRNHISFVKAIFSVSRLGSDVFLLNAEMSLSQFNELAAKHQFDLLIYDEGLMDLVEISTFDKKKIVCDRNSINSIHQLSHKKNHVACKLKRTSASKIILLTGGTTGKPKKVVHQPSLMNYVNPFLTLLTKLKLLRKENMLIATPIYHGYGIAILLSFIGLGKTVFLNRRFSAEHVCEQIRIHQIEAVTVVPLMIDKMMDHNAEDLKSLTCIASGGASINPKLVVEVTTKLGDVLFNLYGTSESGLNCIAAPEDLHANKQTIGKAITGVHLKILDENGNKVKNGQVGQFFIKTRWSMKNNVNAWIATGDLGYTDHLGLFYLCGRTDDMIVSGGENVYPVQLEQLLINHHLIKDVAVIGIDDELFGQRLCAFVEPETDGLTSKDILDWLGSRAARYQIPKEIIFMDTIPYTSVGKQDKKNLKVEVKDCV
ncbi:AMP-binding protein [Sporosarcina aquimarina]|uniref:AMP-binding protein n=1 Tax=Sporosarcina aquimarina TaxID=114975 RepID=A0ABU4G3K6_9BACL|nr:AMP-binding protein [Sporosarcina aquimarina]MDW0110935.1 AMP-binding protein [Sporosarcina aquimarina]